MLVRMESDHLIRTWTPSWNTLFRKLILTFDPFTGAVGHYRRFIKNFARIAAPLYDLVSGVNKDKKSESVTLTPEALEAFEILKKKCVQAPILAFPDFNKTFLLETDASGKGLGAVLSQKQEDGRYHPSGLCQPNPYGDGAKVSF